MTATSLTPTPFVVHEVSHAPSGETRRAEHFEVRPVGLSVIAQLLRMPVADLDGVRFAKSLSDLQCCPVCRRVARTAA